MIKRLLDLKVESVALVQKVSWLCLILILQILHMGDNAAHML